jgi:hypothetical protein
MAPRSCPPQLSQGPVALGQCDQGYGKFVGAIFVEPTSTKTRRSTMPGTIRLRGDTSCPWPRADCRYQQVSLEYFRRAYRSADIFTETFSSRGVGYYGPDSKLVAWAAKNEADSRLWTNI